MRANLSRRNNREFHCGYRHRQGGMWLQQLLEARKERTPNAEFSKNPKVCILEEGVGRKKEKKNQKNMLDW